MEWKRSGETSLGCRPRAVARARCSTNRARAGFKQKQRIFLFLPSKPMEASLPYIFVLFQGQVTALNLRPLTVHLYRSSLWSSGQHACWSNYLIGPGLVNSLGKAQICRQQRLPVQCWGKQAICECCLAERKKLPLHSFNFGKMYSGSKIFKIANLTFLIVLN